jgi:hypothetical protein
MLDKRAFMRDMRSANLGISRRIRLRTRATPETPTPVSGSDPLANAAPLPSTDIITYTVGQFTTLKSSQVYELTGATQDTMGIVYFPVYLRSEIEAAYSMDIGGTEKNWIRVGTIDYDDNRVALKVTVKAAG